MNKGEWYYSPQITGSFAGVIEIQPFLGRYDLLRLAARFRLGEGCPLELADIFSLHADDYLANHKLSPNSIGHECFQHRGVKYLASMGRNMLKHHQRET